MGPGTADFAGLRFRTPGKNSFLVPDFRKDLQSRSLLGLRHHRIVVWGILLLASLSTSRIQGDTFDGRKPVRCT